LAAIGGSLFGYDTGVISGAILFVRPEFGLGTTEVELVVSAALLGAMIGALASGWLTDKLGRRVVLLGAAVSFALGALGSALAPGTTLLIVARLLVGAAIGVASYAVPLYISELAPPRSRGWLVSLNQLAITSGILLAYVVDYAFAASGGWRWMLGLAIVPAVLLGLGVAALPDTPRWLVLHGQAERGRSVLRRVRGGADVSAELDDIQSIVQTPGLQWSNLLTPAIRPALIVGVGLAIVQQVTGINTVIYYAPTILQAAGIPSASGAILATAGVGLVNVIMTVVAMALLDRVGRRPLLLASLAGMAVALAVLAFGFQASTSGSSLAGLSVACLMVFVGSFAVGLGPIFWLLIAEIYPLRLRGLAMSVATTANWASNLVVSLTFLTLIQALGPAYTFWLYGLVTIAAWYFAFRLVPETRGRTLEDIESFWRPRRMPSADHSDRPDPSARLAA
ncbi:MAG TPA: sugar porter family MFS transporter, partial [Chloroflexota bacterium]|jgi:sugar porter (SP) family MFS transporter|nr:sugar porter family MFS transporter [Chloroflexota bacterium]